MLGLRIFPKVTKMGSIIWPQNRLYWGGDSERPAADTQQKLTPLVKDDGCLQEVVIHRGLTAFENCKTQPAFTSRVFMSTAACFCTSLCCTFTATTLPSCSVALWTCAREAAPMGLSSKCANIFSTLPLSSSSMTCFMSRKGL